MVVAFQGEPGAYSEAAAQRFARRRRRAALSELRRRVRAPSRAARPRFGVLPIENSIGGTIHRNYDLLLEHDLQIVGEVELPVVHSLIALPGHDDRRDQDDLLASAGAGPVRAVPAQPARRRSRRHLRHGRQRQADQATGNSRTPAAIASERAAAGVRTRVARVGHPGFRRQHHPLPRGRPRAPPRRRRRPTRRRWCSRWPTKPGRSSRRSASLRCAAST